MYRQYMYYTSTRIRKLSENLYLQCRDHGNINIQAHGQFTNYILINSQRKWCEIMKRCLLIFSKNTHLYNDAVLLNIVR